MSESQQLAELYNNREQNKVIEYKLEEIQHVKNGTLNKLEVL